MDTVTDNNFNPLEQTPKITNSQSSRRLLIIPSSSSSTTVDPNNDDTTATTIIDMNSIPNQMPIVPSLNNNDDYYPHDETNGGGMNNNNISNSSNRKENTDAAVTTADNGDDVLLGQLHPITNTTITNDNETLNDDTAVDTTAVEPTTTTTSSSSSSFFSWFTTSASTTTVVPEPTVVLEESADFVVNDDEDNDEPNVVDESDVTVVVVGSSSVESNTYVDDDIGASVSNAAAADIGDPTVVVESSMNESTPIDTKYDDVPMTFTEEDETVDSDHNKNNINHHSKAEQERVSAENADVFQTTSTTTSTLVTPASLSVTTPSATTMDVVPHSGSNNDVANITTKSNSTSSIYDMEGIQWMIAKQYTNTIPQSQQTIQILYKFYIHTRSFILKQYGGTIQPSMWSYLFGGNSSKGNHSHEHVTFHPYHTLVKILLLNNEDTNHEIPYNDEEDENEDESQQQHGMNGIDTSHNNTSNEPELDGRTTSNNNDPIIQERAQAALVSFIDLFSIWGHASSTWFSDTNTNHHHKNTITKQQRKAYLTLQSCSINTACQLISYGCLDDVYITMINKTSLSLPSTPVSVNHDNDTSVATTTTTDDIHLNNTEEQVPSSSAMMAAQILASSVFNSDITNVQIELIVIQFLLCTGCRKQCTLLRSSYLLQSIRTLYHIYLTTESATNKVTARAALQQLVTNIFTKVVQEQQPQQSVSSTTDVTTIPPTDTLMHDGSGGNVAFPSENHRDAFLVLRSLCKLSMRSLPDDMNHNNTNNMQPAQYQHSHFGLQTSASNDTWDGDNNHRNNVTSHQNHSERNQSSLMSNESQNSNMSATSQHSTSSTKRQQQRPHLVYTGAIHPALESKILALELLLYILLNVDFTMNDFIHHCGYQFHIAIRNYLCVSLLKNCTCNNTYIVNLSLRIFVPVVHNFRTVLKNEIEAFVTNVFFVILQSKNSPANHKSIVVNTFNEICSDPNTLAEIFLNYDCDLSAVDLFYRIVNTLSRLSREGLQETSSGSGTSSNSNVSGSGSSSITSYLLGGPSEAQMEKQRNESRNLRLDAMRALRQILASLHSSIVEPMNQTTASADTGNIIADTTSTMNDNNSVNSDMSNGSIKTDQQTLVDIYGSKKKRRAEEQEAILRFNQKPSAGIAYAGKCHHIDPNDPVDVARYLFKNKDVLDKAMIGEYLGREKEYQNGFSIRVLHEYVRLMDFTDLVFDDAIRYFLSGFRLPGEAQKVGSNLFVFAFIPCLKFYQLDETCLHLIIINRFLPK
jgi:hypothetical protein